MPMFSIPLSGLTASSTALATIANNLANQNTIGFKQARALFRDLFYQQIGQTGSGDPIQVGAGTTVGTIDTNFTDGSVNPTGVDTDVAIMGNGNLTTAEDGIRSADIGQEVANLTKYNILSSTGISALAQANQMQQSVLKLLQ